MPGTCAKRLWRWAFRAGERSSAWCCRPRASASSRACVLSLARAGGETAPLLLTALGNQFFSFNLHEPMAALPVQIYTYAGRRIDDWHTKAWGSALMLVLVIGCLSLLAATHRSTAEGLRRSLNVQDST